MDNTNILRYSDAEDKCFGVAGMSVALVMLDCEDYVAALDIDRDDVDTIVFAPSFAFAGATSVSPRANWEHLLRRLQVSTAMLVANAMSRSYVRRHKVLPQEQLDALLTLVEQEAADVCELVKDEADQVFYKDFDMLDRAFRTSDVHAIVNRLAGELSQRRTMPFSEVLDYFRGL